MNYELALELKDAGFEQNRYATRRFFVLKDGTILDNKIAPTVIVNDITEEVMVPTLSELIEACGEKFWRLERNGPSQQWFAFAVLVAEDSITESAHGTTFEEATARLWLVLNKK